MRTIVDAAAGLIELMPNSLSKFTDCDANLTVDGNSVVITSYFTNGNRVVTQFHLPSAIMARDFSSDNVEKLFKAILAAHVNRSS